MFALDCSGEGEEHPPWALLMETGNTSDHPAAVEA